MASVCHFEDVRVTVIYPTLKFILAARQPPPVFHMLPYPWKKLPPAENLLLLLILCALLNTRDLFAIDKFLVLK